MLLGDLPQGVGAQWNSQSDPCVSVAAVDACHSQYFTPGQGVCGGEHRATALPKLICAGLSRPLMSQPFRKGRHDQFPGTHRCLGLRAVFDPFQLTLQLPTELLQGSMPLQAPQACLQVTAQAAWVKRVSLTQESRQVTAQLHCTPALGFQQHQAEAWMDAESAGASPLWTDPTIWH